MMQPKRLKFRKQQKGKGSRGGCATRGNKVSFGEFGMQCVTPGTLSARQIEAARRVLARATKRIGKIWIRVFTDIPVTQKPPEVRQGKGKGNVEYWVVRVKPGCVLFELAGVPHELAVKACKLAAAKLPVSVRFVEREEI